MVFLTQHAMKTLGDVVYLELAKEGSKLVKGGSLVFDVKGFWGL